MLLPLILLGPVSGAPPANAWARDFAAQPLEKRPRIEARYEDARRRAMVIEGQTYRLVVDLQSSGGHRIRSFAVRAPRGEQELIAGDGANIAIVVGGERYDSRRARSASRVNVYRRGPYLIEAHWLDVRFASADGIVLPVRGEVVFHAYPERVFVEAILHVVDAVEGAHAAFELPTAWKPSRLAAPRTRVLRSVTGAAMGALAWDAPAWAPTEGGLRIAWSPGAANWAAASKQRRAFALLPMPSERSGSALLAQETHPLPASAFRVRAGSPVRYDRVRGCYVIGTHNSGNFSDHYYRHPNQYETAAFTVKNDALARRIVVCHETATGVKGLVECGVLQDQRGDTLPITVQISKNFSGENEERFYNPGDPAFSETYFPLHLAPGEIRSVTSHHLYQNWGSHPLKQFSSLGAWMDYYHMSTGVTETTCYVPFKFDGLHGVQIADMRPFSQRMWDSQPQHDNVAGHTFLRYVEGGRMRDMEYLGTLFRSTGPNWANMSLLLRSEDGKVEGRLDAFELPQTDELRHFVRLRFDVKAPIQLADAAKDFRILSIRSYVQGLRYQRTAWSGEGGRVQDAEIAFDGAVVARPLGGAVPWATVYHDQRGNNAFVVRRWRARLGGVDGIPPASAVEGEPSRNTSLLLTPWAPGPRTLQPGDYVECDLILLPYGPIGTEVPHATPAAEAERYGTHAPHVVRVTRGRVRSHFPTRVDADAAGTAEFTLRGGWGVVSVAVGNLPGYRRPRIEVKDGDAWRPLKHSHTGEDGYQTFVDRAGRFGAVFLVDAGSGAPRTYRATARP